MIIDSSEKMPLVGDIIKVVSLDVWDVGNEIKRTQIINSSFKVLQALDLCATMIAVKEKFLVNLFIGFKYIIENPREKQIEDI